MAIKKERILEHLVKAKDAARHAAFHLHIGVFTKTPGMTTWIGANLEEPTTIYDLNGLPLFYDYPVLSLQHEKVGMIRASASRVLGVPVPATYISGPHWDIKSATQRAHKYVEDELKGKIIDSKPVCYGYPKLGIAVNWEDSKDQAKRTIIDVGDHSIVPENVEPEDRKSGAISVYDLIPEEMLPDAIERFILYDKMVDELQERADVDLAGFLAPEEFHRVQTSLIEMIPWHTSKILTTCSQDYSHKCIQMHAQENMGYCVAATWQMIFDFWSYNYSQDEIDAALDAALDKVKGLQSLAVGFDVINDVNPTFNEVKNEIDASMPFEYSYPSHATVCAGYRQVNLYPVGMEPEKSVCLYDPYPPPFPPTYQDGTIRWEEIGDDNVNIWKQFDGFVYLRPKQTALLLNHLRDFLSVIYKFIKWGKN